MCLSFFGYFSGHSNTMAMHFKKQELDEATASFDRSRLVGKGAYGSVYLGRNLRNSGTSAAVKVLNKV